MGGQERRQRRKLEKRSDRGRCWVGVLEKRNGACKKCAEVEDTRK